MKTIAEERALINKSIRSFFHDRGFVEVETPILVQSPGMEPNLTPFETIVRKPDGLMHPGALITSPEYAMKKLLAAGMEKIFTITKVFRNEETFGGQHNPEFTMLEWYRQGQDYQACMDETETLIEQVAQTPFRFERIRIADLFLKYIHLDLDRANRVELLNACKRLSIHVDPGDTESDLFYRLFLEKIEPTFKGQNIFVYDYPRYQAALATLTKDKRYGQRFELYMSGLEICNGFTELTDSSEQKQRFDEEIKERIGLDKTIFPIDEELLRGLDHIQSPTYGNALGVDRLHMILTGRKSIDGVLSFPAANLFS